MSQNQRRILFLINGFSIGGGERVFLSQANMLAAAGWDVYVATLFFDGDLRGELSVANDHYINLGAHSPVDLRALSKLSHFIRTHDIAIVYSTLNDANTMSRLLKLRHPKMRLYSREANMADVKPRLYKFLDILLGFLSYRIIAVSHAVADSIGSYAPWLLRRMRVLYNGVSLAPPVLHPASSESTRLLTVGSLTPKKNQVALIDAMRILPESFELTIAGDGPLRQQLRDHAKDLGNRVTFRGAIPQHDVFDLYQKHDIFVLPSEREGCPNVVSEAQSFGLPVIAFDIPGMSEFVDETSGILIQQRDAQALAAAIEHLAIDKKAVQMLGEGGREKVARDRDLATQMSTLTALLQE
jgi:glycosyltransferase involved in cell wall biosynthesis